MWELVRRRISNPLPLYTNSFMISRCHTKLSRSLWWYIANSKREKSLSVIYRQPEWKMYTSSMLFMYTENKRNYPAMCTSTLYTYVKMTFPEKKKKNCVCRFSWVYNFLYIYTSTIHWNGNSIIVVEAWYHRSKYI